MLLILTATTVPESDGNGILPMSVRANTPTECLRASARARTFEEERYQHPCMVQVLHAILLRPPENTSNRVPVVVIQGNLTTMQVTRSLTRSVACNTAATNQVQCDIQTHRL